MRILACFLLCSMMGGASEVLFAEVKNSIKGKFGRTAGKFPVTSAPTPTRVPCIADCVRSIEPNHGGLDSEQAIPTARSGEIRNGSGIETVRFEAATWKSQTAR